MNISMRIIPMSEHKSSANLLYVQAGVDSLGAVELRNAVAEQYNISLPATTIFDYPSPTSLAAFVLSLIAPMVEVVEPTGRHVTTLEQTRLTNGIGVSAISCSFPGHAHSRFLSSHILLYVKAQHKQLEGQGCEQDCSVPSAVLSRVQQWKFNEGD